MKDSPFVERHVLRVPYATVACANLPATPSLRSPSPMDTLHTVRLGLQMRGLVG